MGVSGTSPKSLVLCPRRNFLGSVGCGGDGSSGRNRAISGRVSSGRSSAVSPRVGSVRNNGRSFRRDFRGSYPMSFGGRCSGQSMAAKANRLEQTTAQDEIPPLGGSASVCCPVMSGVCPEY